MATLYHILCVLSISSLHIILCTIPIASIIIIYGYVGPCLTYCMTLCDSNTVEVAVKNLNEVLEKGDPAQTLKALKNPDGNFPFIYQDGSKYHKALLKEKKGGLPGTILVSRVSGVAIVLALSPNPLLMKKRG